MTKQKAVENYGGFGLAPLRMEGCAVHPDEIIAEISDEYYIKQAKRYMKDTGDIDTVFVRDELIAAEMRKLT